MPPRKRRPRKAVRVVLVCAAILFLGFWELWNIDMARQTIQIAWLNATGGMWKLRGHVEKTTIKSAALQETHKVLVYLPPGYDDTANRSRRYPVLYLLHGFPDPAGDGWARFGLGPQVVDKSMVQQEIPPLIIVMPDAHAKIGKFGDGEYLNAPVASPQTPGTQMEMYISRDVVQWADKNYRTLPTPSARFIGGISTGAYGAVNIGLKHPNVFGTILSISGYYRADLKVFGKPLWPPSPAPTLVARESPLDYLDGPNPRWKNTLVWFGEGNSDYADAKAESQDFADALQKSGVPFIHHRSAGHHSWDAWRLMLVESLRATRARIPGEMLAGEGSPTR